MDISLRKWLVVIGLIVIADILFDGWRRMWGGKGKLKLKLDRSFANLPDDDGDSAELLGSARVVEHRGLSFDEQDLPSVSARETKKRKSSKRQEEPRQDDLDLDEGLTLEAGPSDATESVESRKGKSKERKEKEREKAPAVAAEPVPVDEVLIINAIAHDESGFKGPALLQNILESGLRFGDMGIFHRHESMAGNDEILFSMANAVKPGTFDLDDIGNFSTRAASFFLGLPRPRHPKQAFDVMVAAACKLAHELNGELRDGQRSVLTVQTIERYRQRIIDHERRGLMQKC